MRLRRFVPLYPLLAVVLATAALFASGGFDGSPALADPGHPRWQSLSGGVDAQRSATAAIVPGAPCPATPTFSFTVPDATGDAAPFFGVGPLVHDITSISAEGDATTVCLTVEFAAPIDPADAGTGNELVGFLEFDTDADLFTGFIPGQADFLCPDRAGLGVDTTLDLFSVFGGMALLVPFGTAPNVLVPVVFDTNAFTAAIPIAELGGDTTFNMAALIGTFIEPTDCAPNGGSIGSPTGALVPVPPLPDTDGDGTPDIFDNCPDLANPDQLDRDFDLIGDACDPTPTHDLAVTRVRAEGETIDLRDEDDDDDDDDGDDDDGAPGVPPAFLSGL